MFSLKTFNDQFPDENSCIDWMIDYRWNGEPVCQKCGCLGAYKITVKGKAGKSDRHLLKCKACRKQFTVKVGTIFEDSAVPLRTWFLGIFLLTTRKKGTSSIQLADDLEVTQKTAWFMLHRIRHAINSGSFDEPLNGTIECDETYIGGKRKGKRGRGAAGKTPVAGCVQRGGKAKVEVVENVKASTLIPLIQKNVAVGSVVMTDELRSYNKLPSLGFSHATVNHGTGQYVDGVAYVNGAENFWKHFKKGIEAIYIHISKKHLQKYCDEFTYRFNQRELEDSQKFTEWFRHCEKRLTYSKLIS